jgi:predicted PurR-regulated permease PerM
MSLSFQKLFFAIATVIALFAIMISAKVILIPLGLALLISFILLPLSKKFESWGMNRNFAAFVSILTLVVLFAGGIFFFSNQIIGLSKAFSDFQDKITDLFTNVILYISNLLGFVTDIQRDSLLSHINQWLKDSAVLLVKNTFSSTASFLAGLLATIIYTFLILIYRDGLTQAFIKFSPDDKRDRVLNMFKNVQKVGQKYLSGMFTLILVLGFANSIGLWIIGIDSPFLFGFLAATLTIIPYVGTTLGATIPVLYAFMSHDSLWVPMTVIGLFWSIQIIETNFLSPRIVGGSLKINALAAILSLIVGALVWGIAGMILFMPFAAMLKVICAEYEELKPIALLIGDQNTNGKDDNDKPIGKWLKKIKKRLPKVINPSKKTTQRTKKTLTINKIS